MKDEILMSLGKIDVVAIRYESDNIKDDLQFEWIEYQPAPYSDDEVQVDIDENQARDLIKILSDHFDINLDAI